MKNLLICVDRDGTLIFDEKYHLGRTDDWKSKVKVLPTVIDGLKYLDSFENASVYMITNQPGVAIKDFPLLTLDRANEVCRYVINELEGLGGRIKGYFFCPHAHPDYVKKRSKYQFDKEMVCDCDCIKPNPGLVFKALEAEGLTLKNTDVYVIGDRSSDVKTALNIKGKGILVPFENEPGHVEKVMELNQAHIHIAKSFLDATYFIKSQ
jgi:histidinol-phosphate phosphatase family protein